MLGALADWAAEQRAEGMYTQVTDENAAARRLYGRVGFEPLCRYHYREAAGQV